MSSISADLKNKVRRQARNRCGYCQTPQEIISMPFEMEHIIPRIKGGTETEENLWLACRNCNGFKHSKTHAIDTLTNEETAIFNPRRQVWTQRFKFSPDKTEIVGTTACGRATVLALRLNFDQAVEARKRWVGGGWFPPGD